MPSLEQQNGESPELNSHNSERNEGQEISVKIEKGSLPSTFEGGFDDVPAAQIEAELKANPELLDRILSEKKEDPTI